MANFLECRKAEVQHPRNPLLEAAPIGWQLFVLESGKSASIAFLLLLATYATRLLAQALRRLMSNCGKRGRSRNSMLALNLRPKVVPHGPRLLLGLIVRISGRLVAGRPRSGPEPPGSSGPAHGPGGHHPGDPGPIGVGRCRTSENSF